MKQMTVEVLQAELNRLDKGILLGGSHKAGQKEFCVLEFDSQVRGREFSDEPVTLPDIRPLNDGFSNTDESNQRRTTALLPLMAAYWNWAEWSKERQLQIVTTLVIQTVRQIIAELSELPEEIAEKCRKVDSLDSAASAALSAAASAALSARSAALSARSAALSAARSATYAAAESARMAARSAARSAALSARSAASAAARSAALSARSATYAAAESAARDKVMEHACQIWIDAATQGNQE